MADRSETPSMGSNLCVDYVLCNDCIKKLNGSPQAKLPLTGGNTLNSLLIN